MALLTEMYRGDTKKVRITCMDRLGQTFDISGNRFFIGFKAALTDPDPGPVHVLHVAGSGSEDDPANGVVVVTIPSTQSATLDPTLNGDGLYYYELQRVVPGSPNEVYTLEQGRVKILRDVVQSTS